jgi:Zn-finger nucleic acid-binding protein
MKCPGCGEITIKKTIQGAEFEECTSCHGMWFEKNELRKAKDAVDPDLDWLDFDLWSKHENLQLEWSQGQCPVCDEKLVSMEYGDTQVLIDYCQAGHGVFLNQGEFEGIITAMEKDIDQKNAPEYIRAALGEAKEIITGKEGLASEWHDFATVMRLLEYRLMSEHPSLARLLVAFNLANPLK